MRISQWKTKLLLSLVYMGVVILFYSLRLSCVFQTIFGIVCPGCGMTRATIAALHLHFKEAFGYHPMFWSMPILYLYFWIDGGLFRKGIWDKVILWGIGAGFVLNWLLKLW